MVQVGHPGLSWASQKKVFINEISQNCMDNVAKFFLFFKLWSIPHVLDAKTFGVVSKILSQAQEEVERWKNL